MRKLTDLKNGSDCVVVSRAASAIYLILKKECRPGDSVLVPADLCYAAIYPILYADMHPVFCDVDPKTGNITAEIIDAADLSGVTAAVIPHMYGNPVDRLDLIARKLHSKGILVIEDCASAMGAESDGYPLGETGDYTVYSTGYAKILDLGTGGLLMGPEDKIPELYAMERMLPDKSEEETVGKTSYFSKLYRFLRNNGQDGEIAQGIYRVLPEIMREAFIRRIPEELVPNILSRLSDVEQIVEERRAQYALWEETFSDINADIYPYKTGSVPWRFSLYFPYETKRRIIDACLEKGLPVSDWYPSVMPVFGKTDSMEGIAWHEEHIINFPILLPADQREMIASVIRSFI